MTDSNKNGIFFHDGIFTLQTENSTYQMKADKLGVLLHLYYGKKMCGVTDYLPSQADRGFSPNPYDAGADRTYSLDFLPLEFPVRGVGDFRSPALDMKYADSSWGLDLRYKSYKISDGKYSLPGLPAVYSENAGDEAQTLEILLEDSVSKVQVKLLYGVLPKLDIITRSVAVTNLGENSFTVEKLQAACLDFACGSYDFIKFYGRHAMERNAERTPITHASQVIGSRRGTSSHQYSPVMIVCKNDATENSGSAWGLNFAYSGGFKGEAEKDQFNATRVQLGLQDEMLSYPVAKGETFWSPEVIMTYSDKGIGQVSRNFHKCIARNVCRGKYRDEVRPVLLNSWEANYFNISKDSILKLAKDASKLGIEMLVMDDGWFGKRDDDNSGLGDWIINEKKIGCSLKELVEKVNETGLKFGIWFEPEMINEDSDLYRAHPDWALNFKGRKPVRGRNQLVLDYSRPEVVEAIFTQMCKVLDSANIEYVKWDFNRSINDVYTYAENVKNQGSVLYDFIKGTYSLAEKLTSRYPNILFEGCSGGGGRFDAGMMFYTPQIWCSDNTDAIDRTRIQYGTSFAFPASTVGSHVSIVPNHQTGRICPMKTRGVVAMAGTFGYELDLAKISSEEKCEIKEQVKAYKKYAHLIKNGDYYRLTNPFADETASWAFVAEDKSEALVSSVQLEMHGNMTPLYVPVYGLQSGCIYRDEESGRLYPSDALEEMGLPVTEPMLHFKAYQWHLVRM